MEEAAFLRSDEAAAPDALVGKRVEVAKFPEVSLGLSNRAGWPVALFPVGLLVVQPHNQPQTTERFRVEAHF